MTIASVPFKAPSRLAAATNLFKRGVPLVIFGGGKSVK
jgi:hypothetical protein